MVLLKSVGVDPGFTNVGLATSVFNTETRESTVVDVSLVKTEKIEKKARSAVRVSTDDQRRAEEIIDDLCAYFDTHKPSIIVVEGYSPYSVPMKGGWKTVLTQGSVLAIAKLKGILLYTLLPLDLKMHFLKKNKGGKNEVIAAVKSVHVEAAQLIDSLPKTKREHVADAIGYSLIGCAEIEKQMRITTGV